MTMPHAHAEYEYEHGTVTEHALPVTAANPDACTPAHDCAAHPKGHAHGPGCGYEPEPHGDHCDDHGPSPCRSRARPNRG